MRRPLVDGVEQDVGIRLVQRPQEQSFGGLNDRQRTQWVPALELAGRRTVERSWIRRRPTRGSAKSVGDRCCSIQVPSCACAVSGAAYRARLGASGARGRLADPAGRSCRPSVWALGQRTPNTAPAVSAYCGAVTAARRSSARFSSPTYAVRHRSLRTAPTRVQQAHGTVL